MLTAFQIFLLLCDVIAFLGVFAEKEVGGKLRFLNVYAITGALFLISVIIERVFPG